MEKKNILPFARSAAKLFRRTDAQRRCVTYLPPITKPVTEYSTIIEIFYQSRMLSQKCKMPYTPITIDAGATMKAFLVI